MLEQKSWINSGWTDGKAFISGFPLPMKLCLNNEIDTLIVLSDEFPFHIPQCSVIASMVNHG